MPSHAPPVPKYSRACLNDRARSTSLVLGSGKGVIIGVYMQNTVACVKLDSTFNKHVLVLTLSLSLSLCGICIISARWEADKGG